MLTKTRKVGSSPLKKKQARSNRPLTQFRPQVRSRHPSHSPLRTQLSRLPFRSVIRLGSTTDLPDTVTNGGRRIECNTITAVRNSADKLLMKECFDRGNVMTAAWDNSNFEEFTHETEYPFIIKRRNSSRGRGIYLIQSAEDLNNFLRNHNNLNNYIIEKFHNFSREYRLHVTKDGCFYTNRKMLRSETPDNQRWYRNDSNCVWILEDNPSFDKPANWDIIVRECVKALNAVGLDIGACDVKVQSATDSRGRTREAPQFIVVEINSAPSFGEGTLRKYLEVLPTVLLNKRNGTSFIR